MLTIWKSTDQIRSTHKDLRLNGINFLGLGWLRRNLHSEINSFWSFIETPQTRITAGQIPFGLRHLAHDTWNPKQMFIFTDCSRGEISTRFARCVATMIDWREKSVETSWIPWFVSRTSKRLWPVDNCAPSFLSCQTGRRTCKSKSWYDWFFNKPVGRGRRRAIFLSLENSRTLMQT